MIVRDLARANKRLFRIWGEQVQNFFMQRFDQYFSESLYISPMSGWKSYAKSVVCTVNSTHSAAQSKPRWYIIMDLVFQSWCELPNGRLVQIPQHLQHNGDTYSTLDVTLRVNRQDQHIEVSFYRGLYWCKWDTCGLKAMHEIGCTRCRLLTAEWEDLRWIKPEGKNSWREDAVTGEHFFRGGLLMYERVSKGFGRMWY